MVERPIKKSDRPPADDHTPKAPTVETGDLQIVERSSDRPIKKSERPAKSLDESGDSRSTKGGDKGADKRKGREKYSREDEPSPGRTGLALQRGPRPTKPKPEVLPEVTEPLETSESLETPENSEISETAEIS
jgi:hypothetical protein